MYEPRFYRNQTLAKDLYSFEVRIKETDLFISADRDLKAVAHELVYFYRGLVEEFIGRFPLFKETLVPIEVPKDAPDIVKSEYVGRGLLEYSDEVIVENGGDIFIKTERDRKMGIYASESPLSNRIAIAITPDDTPLGICTSSGTVGHSLSFGKADAVVILSASTSLADATATKVGNIIHSKDDIRKAIEFAQSVPGIEGAIIVVGDGLGGWGKFEFIPA
jgi:ApbE superfamily uncharacterized protein (UPF0280 family)